jgi:hypothetical protein
LCLNLKLTILALKDVPNRHAAAEWRTHDKPARESVMTFKDSSNAKLRLAIRD